MDYLNKVELQGIVGHAKQNAVGNDTAVRFSVMTEHAYKRGGDIIIDTMWHNCTAWASKNPVCLDLNRGDKVKVVGRMRTQTFIDAQGREKGAVEIIVSELKKMD